MQHFGVCKKRAFGIPMPLPLMLNDKCRQAVRIMKITAFILLVCLLQVSAKVPAQEKITIKEKGASLVKIFTQINKQTGYNFLFTNEDLRDAKPVDIEVKNASLKDVLDLLFKKQDLTYIITEKIITILPKKNDEPSKDATTILLPIDIHGKVIDENGKPVPGVTVIVKGTKKQTVTDENGEFTISAVERNAVLSFSTINMEPFEILVDGKAEIFAKLKTKISELDEVQIIAYGQTTKRLQTGNVSTVKGEDIQKQPVGNPLLALEGRVPGLYISQSTGISGSAVSVMIRGKNSISNGNDPFYVVDGVPYTSQLLPNLNTTLGTTVTGQNVTTNFGNPLTYLNPSDIESIEVLKDADATAIYGSRAANGAILITTKKGKSGRTQLGFSLQNGWGKVNRKLDLLNTQQYLEMRHEAIANDGKTVTPYDYDINGVWDTTKNTDWQKELIGGTSHYLDAQLSISGGNDNTQFLIAAGHHRETAVVPGDFKDQKASVHFNIVNKSSNNKFRIELNGNYLIDNNRLPSVDLTTSAIRTAPDAPALYNADGTLNWAPVDPDVFDWGTWTNPLAVLNSKFKGQTNNLISNAIASYQLLPSLEIKSNFGYTNMQVNEVSYYPSTYFDPYLVSLAGNSLRSASYADNSISSWIIEPQLTYHKEVGKGTLNALIGFSVQENKMRGTIINGTGYSSDLLLEDVQSASSTAIGNSNEIYKYNAGFGRLTYNWMGKYIVNLNVRRDGSSRFGPENRFHNFGSGGAAWIFTKEKFFQNNPNLLSFGKIRASYGTTGNDQIANYQFFDLYHSGSSGVPYQGSTGLYINNLYNPFLQWEETKKLEGAMELGFFRDRILFSLSYFQNRSSNQLIQNPLPATTGFSNITTNLPATVQNSGLEMTLSTTNIKSRHFSWSSSFNITVPKNKLIAFPGLENSPYKNIYAVGMPITISRPYHYAGVDPQTGIYTFADSHGGVVFTPNELTVKDFINLAPEYYGGLSNTLTFKGFQLDFLFQFTKQTGQNYLFSFLPGYQNWFNQPTTVLNRWQKPSDDAPIQRYTTSTGFSVNGHNVYSAYNYASQSSLAYSDASFIRMKNLSLSWQLPEQIKKKIKLQSCTFFIQGQNLLTITNYKGLDPETKSTSLPPLRVWTIGIRAGL